MIEELALIQQIKSVLRQKEELLRTEADLCTPKLTDMSRIAEIYRIFCDHLAGQDPASRPESPHQRKKFIFIVLYLYAPQTLAGCVTPRGLRGTIASAIGLSDVTFISNNIETIAFLVQNDKYFRHDVDHLYNAVLEQLFPST